MTEFKKTDGMLSVPQAAFLSRLEELYDINVEISRKKNSDYADQGDAFKNFKACKIYGVPVDKGLIVRMSDKMTRLANLMDRPAQVADESVLDTLSDLANYAMILRMWLEFNDPDFQAELDFTRKAKSGTVTYSEGGVIHIPSEDQDDGHGTLPLRHNGGSLSNPV